MFLGQYDFDGDPLSLPLVSPTQLALRLPTSANWLVPSEAQ